jgi:hypothetical protein
MTPNQYATPEDQSPYGIPPQNIDQFQGTADPSILSANATSEPMITQQVAEGVETQNQQNLEPQIPTARLETDDPMGFIRQNTPNNDIPVEALQEKPFVESKPFAPNNYPPEVVPETPSVSTESEEKEHDLKEQLNAVKELLSVVLENQEIRDYGVFPVEMVNPQIYTSENSQREMIRPLSIDKIKFGYKEFKEALNNALALNETTYILKYLSGRVGQDGNNIKPKFLKFKKEQVDKLRTEIDKVEQNRGAYTSLNAY